VVEKIGNVSLEIVDVEDPSAVGNGDAELMFFIALTPEGQKLAGVGGLVTERFQLAGNGFDGRRLIVVTVESAEGPMNFWNGDRGAEARTDGGLGDWRLG